MINIMLAGVGGQGTVLAAKILAQAARERGWHVRTGETIGMAQRGGSVTSHVRMGDGGETVQAPLIMPASADVIIAFEPGEGARALPYLAEDGLLLSASTCIQPVTAALSSDAYRAADVFDGIRHALAPTKATLRVVDEDPILEKVGTRRALNTVLLASAIAAGTLPLGIDDLKAAVSACVKPRFVDLNLAAIDLAAAAVAD